MSWSSLVTGDAVEVLYDDGESSTWRPARIIHPFINRHLYFVSFCNGAPRATIPADRVRPKPASADAADLDFGQLVDVLVDGVWKPGVISKVHVVEGETRYGVCLTVANEEIEVGSGEIRVRVHWIDGKWVLAEQKDKSPNSENHTEEQLDCQIECDAAHKCRVPTSITPLSGGGDEDLQPPISTPKAEILNTDRLNFQSQLECLHPCKKAKKEEATEGNIKVLDLGGTEASKVAEFSAEKMGFDVRTLIVEEESNFHIKALVEKMDAASVVCSVARPSPNTLSENPSEKASQASILLHKPQSNKWEVLSKERPVNSEFLQSAEWSQYMGVGWASEQRKELDLEDECQRDKEAGQPTLREKRRKNSRPQKLTITRPSLEGDSGEKQQKIGTVDGPQIGGLPTPKCGTYSDNGLEAQEQCNMAIGSSDVSLIETSASDSQGSEAGSKSEGDVLFSTIGKQFAAQKQLQWPFEKCSLMWGSMELIKAFSLMPQSPHFLPLQKYRKDFREGMAIGLMVTFSNLVDNITKLQICDSRDEFDGMLKTLGILEWHGFDVQRLKSRLVDLLRLKADQEGLADEISNLESVLVKKQEEKERLNAERESIEKSVMELEQSLSHLYEFRSCILEEKRERDARLDELETESTRVENAMLAAKHEFEATLSATW